VKRSHSEPVLPAWNASPQALSRPLPVQPVLISPPAAETPRRDPSLQADLNNGLRRIGMVFFVLLFFMRGSTIHETLAANFGIPYVLFLAAPPAIAFALFSGGLQKVLSHKSGIFWLLFVVWMALAIPTSIWISASFGLWMTYVRTEIPLLLCAAGLIASMKDLDRVFWAGALACVVLSVTSRMFMNLSYGRIALDFGTISNANDFAAHQIFLLPFVAYLIVRPGTNFLVRMIAMAECAYCLYQILGSASRGAMLGLFVMATMIFFNVTMVKKMVVVILAPLAFVVAFAALPATTTSRLFAIFNSSQQASQTESEVEAALSKEKRMYLLGKSIEYTFEKPLLGVGPGQFSVYEGKNSKVIGDHGAWNQTHNVYTQISSECGIPALLFYLGAIVSSILIFARVHRYAKLRKDCEHLATASFCLLVGTVGFSITIFFLTLGYRFYLPMLSGVAIAMHEVARREYNLFGQGARPIFSPLMRPPVGAR
jgi:hypothetical protein